jgi:hypothetical protein
MKCSCCDLEIAGIPTDWAQSMPGDVWRLSKAERRARVKPFGSDLLVIDHLKPTERSFLRCILDIPIVGSAPDAHMCFGLWARMKRDDILAMLESPEWKGGRLSSSQQYPGAISATDDLQPLEPLDDAAVHVVFAVDPKKRCNLILTDETHPVWKRQTEGVSVEWWHAYVAERAPGAGGTT